MKIDWKLIVAIIAGVLLIGYLIRRGWNNVKETAGDVADYLATDGVNVTSKKNIVNTVVNGAVKATGVTGKNDFTGEANSIGSALEEVSRPIRFWANDMFGTDL